MPDSPLEDIRSRVADGICLTNNYHRVFELYVEANNDRRSLLKLLDAKGTP